MPFGRAQNFARATESDTEDQVGALNVLIGLIEKGGLDSSVARAAKAIVTDCTARDDECELQAIYDAVKSGCACVPGMKNGFRYVSDPRSLDAFWAAPRLLTECRTGSCGGDCDDATVLVGALCAALGFRVGARAYAAPHDRDYSHVYPVVLVSKRGPWKSDSQGRFLEDAHVRGMDITVPEAEVGWQPPTGRVMTAWIE